jgi:DMSO/TMAO reductase YedYZ molybdopterin-dependent catalytic subunit
MKSLTPSAATEPAAPRTRRPLGRRFAIGVGAMAVALAFTYAARVVLGAVPYPPEIIQDILRTIAPGKLDQAAIRGLQHWAQRLLFIGIHIALLGLGGYFATLFAGPDSPPRLARKALGVAAIFFLAATILALAGDEGSSWPAFLVYAGAALGYARLASGTPYLRVVDPEVRSGEMPLDAIRRSRRSFLGRSAVVAGVVLVFGGALVKSLMRRSQPVTIVKAGTPFAPPAPDPTFPAVAGLSPEITANDDFYDVDIDFLKPSVDSSSWQLTIDGLVTNPYMLNFHQLQTEFEVVELAHTLSCISNEVGGDLVSTAVWRGVRMSDVLGRAGLKPGVVEIVFKATDGFSDSIAMQWINQPDSMIAFGMNGTALPVEHGFPARVIVPGLYGMKQPKWLTGITAVNHHYNGYWEVRGWDEQAIMGTQSRFDVPTPGTTVGVPSYLAGIAWAGVRGISKVEVSYDGGTTWSSALLKRELSPVAWRLWAIGVAPGSGPRRVLVRATDGTGAVQVAEQNEPDPGPATGWDFVTFQLR